MKSKINIFYIALTIVTFIVFIVSRFYINTNDTASFFDLFFVLVTMLFNVIIMTVYRKHRKLLLYAFLSTINVLGYHMYNAYFADNLMGIVLGFIIPLTFYSSVGSLFVAFWIALSEEYMKFVSRLLMVIAVNNYVFYTIYVTYTERNIIGFFGPFPEDLDVVFNILYFVKDFNLTVIVALQTVILYYLASGKKFWNYRRTKIEDVEVVE